MWLLPVLEIDMAVICLLLHLSCVHNFLHGWETALGCFTLLTGISIVQTTASESGLFDHLINVWEFKPGPVPGTCDLYFLVDFKFQSPLYRQVCLLQYCASNNLSYGPLQSESFSCQVASMFFKEVVSRLVSSLSDRCFRIYGPPVPVLENSYGQGRWK
jgi:coenzyme Q-binding protein COQ10